MHINISFILIFVERKQYLRYCPNNNNILENRKMENGRIMAVKRSHAHALTKHSARNSTNSVFVSLSFIINEFSIKVEQNKQTDSTKTRQNDNKNIYFKLKSC